MKVDAQIQEELPTDYLLSEKVFFPKALLQETKLSDLKLLITNPTRISKDSKSVIDLIAVSYLQNIRDAGVQSGVDSGDDSRVVLKAKAVYNRRLIDKSGNGHKVFWRTVKKSLPGERKAASPKISIGGTLT